MGLEFLIPLALEILTENPLIEGDMYKGDLLANVADVPDQFWMRHPDLNNQLVEIKDELVVLVETIQDELIPTLSSMRYMK